MGFKEEKQDMKISNYMNNANLIGAALNFYTIFPKAQR